MVELSKSIANKIKDKQGDITEDEVSMMEYYQKTHNFMQTGSFTRSLNHFLNIFLYIFLNRRSASSPTS